MFVLVKESEKYAVRLLSNNGQVLLKGRSYANKASCKRVITQVCQLLSSGTDSLKIESLQKGQVICINARNGHLLAQSKVYRSKPGVINAVSAIQRLCAEPVIHDTIRDRLVPVLINRSVSDK